MTAPVSTAPATRTFDGETIPAAGTWTIDPSHSHVGFSVKHLMVAKTRGVFGAFSATATIADDPTESSVVVEIDAASIDTQDDKRDGHLRSPDFFDVEQFPTLTYRSTSVRHVRGDRWSVDGDLTVAGVTQPVTLDVTLEGIGGDPWGGTRAGFTATAEIDREDFGLTWNQALETGGVLVGKKVKIEIEAELVRSA